MKTLFMGNVPGKTSAEKAANVQDGTLTMTIDILAITGLNFEVKMEMVFLRGAVV